MNRFAPVIPAYGTFYGDLLVFPPSVMGTVSVTYISELFIISNNLGHFFVVSLFDRPSFPFYMVIALGMLIVYAFSPFSVHFTIYFGVWRVCLHDGVRS